MRIAISTRISKDDAGDSLSPDVQRRQIEACCARDNHEIVGYYEDRNVSGGIDFADRPAFSQLLKDIKPKRIEGIMCLCMDRLSRDLRQLVNFVFEARQRKIAILFVQEKYDDSPTGKMMMQIAAMFAEYYRDFIGVKVRDHNSDRARRGEWPCGQPIYGYRWNSESGLIEIDEDFADYAVQIFQTYIECAGNRHETTRLLNHNGIPSKRGKGWTITQLKRVITNPLYQGQIRYNDILTDVDIPEVVPRYLVDTALKLCEATTMHPVRMQSHVYPYGSLVVCSKCGYKYTGAQNRKWRPYYVCGGRVHAVCDASGINTQRLDNLVGQALEQAFSEYMEITQKESAVMAPKPRKKKRVNSEAAISRLLDFYEQGIISKEVYLERIAKYQVEESEEPKKPVTYDPALIKKWLTYLKGNWGDVDDLDKRRLLLQTVERIVLTTSKPAKIALYSPLTLEPVYVVE